MLRLIILSLLPVTTEEKIILNKKSELQATIPAPAPDKPMRRSFRRKKTAPSPTAEGQIFNDQVNLYVF